MNGDIADLPDDVDALKAVLAVERAKMREVAAERDAGTAELAVARAKASEDLALIAHQKLRIAKLERQLYGPRSERSALLIEQLALQFEEREANATEDELAAESAVAKTTTVAAFTRKRPERNTFPDHLPRERVVITPPTACDCCGGTRLRKLGEDVTKTLESIPCQWKVIETVREKFTCRDCEKISQAPAPFHVIPRGWAGANLLAMVLFEKFGQHQPLNRQAERYAREGVPIRLSTMADAVGASCVALNPILRLVEVHVLAAERLHGDDTTVPVLAKGKTDTGRCWVYVRDDTPFAGAAPPAAMFYDSRDRKGEHPQRHLASYAGLFQADAFDGYRQLYLPDRSPGRIVEAGCWVHARRPFFAMADLEENARRQAARKQAVPLSPIAIEIVRRIDALFDIERTINGRPAEERRAVRQGCGGKESGTRHRGASVMHPAVLILRNSGPAFRWASACQASNARTGQVVEAAHFPRRRGAGGSCSARGFRSGGAWGGRSAGTGPPSACSAAWESGTDSTMEPSHGVPAGAGKPGNCVWRDNGGYRVWGN